MLAWSQLDPQAQRVGCEGVGEVDVLPAVAGSVGLGGGRVRMGVGFGFVGAVGAGLGRLVGRVEVAVGLVGGIWAGGVFRGRHLWGRCLDRSCCD